MSTCCVCLEAKPKVLECPSCQQTGCAPCQVQFGSARCMSCSTAFTERFLKKAGHAQLIKTLLRPAEENLLWDREKERLPMTQQLVDWENAVIELSKRLRFGFRVEFPPKPNVLLSDATVFPCPAVDCRGFVLPSEKKCGSCKKTVCMLCRAFEAADHKCDNETLKTLALLQADSKPCPKCCAPIFRTAGCNHMFCTNCRTHFDWLSRNILKQSTNYHYTSTSAFATNVATLDGNGGTNPRASDAACFYNVMTNAVSLAEAIPTQRVARYLWDEMVMVRGYLRSELDTAGLTDDHQHSLIKVRMQFLRGVPESQCKKKIWLLEKQFERRMEESTLLTQFLLEILKLQRRVAQGSGEKQVMSEFQNMISFFNSCFEDIESKLVFKIYEGPLLNLQ